MFYLPVIYSTLGSAHSAALLSAVVTNAVNLVCTFVAIAVVDRFGRRGLFLEGGIQMIITVRQLGCSLALDVADCQLMCVPYTATCVYITPTTA